MLTGKPKTVYIFAFQLLRLWNKTTIIIKLWNKFTVKMEIYCTKKDNPNGTMELFNLFIIIISESIKKIRVAKLYSCDISSGSGSIYIYIYLYLYH